MSQHEVSDEPRGEGSYVVRHGDDLHSIAFRHGLAPEAIWDAAENEAIREARTPVSLLPGDRLHLPEPPPPSRHVVQIGGTHRFTAQVPRHEVRLQLRSGGESHPSERYTAEIDGRIEEGTIGGDGAITLRVTPRTREVVLTIHEEWDDFEHDHRMVIDVGGLDPIDSPTGVQARLRALRVDTGPVDGDVGPRTQAALAELQRRHGREPIGRLDAETLAWLQELHGA